MTAIESLTDRMDYAIVGPRDSRQRVSNTSVFPFNTICHLARDFGDGRLAGCSGVLVAPRLVLTAAHCLYSTKRKRGPSRIVVTAGRSGGSSAPFGKVTATRFVVPRKFVRPTPGHSRRSNDYGFILLPRRFARLSRFAPVVAASTAMLRQISRNGLVGIAGYPGDKPRGTMWYHKERLVKATPRRLYYTVDTCPGHSGSPVFSYASGSGTVSLIGVHTTGIVDRDGRSHGCKPGTVYAPSGKSNSGVRIVPGIASIARHPTQTNLSARGMIRPPR